MLRMVDTTARTTHTCNTEGLKKNTHALFKTLTRRRVLHRRFVTDFPAAADVSATLNRSQLLAILNVPKGELAVLQCFVHIKI